MKKSFIPLIVFAITTVSGATIEDRQKQEAGLQSWRELSETAETLPEDEAIERLGRGILKLNKSAIYSIPESKVVAHELTLRMIAIPGHAEYYDKRIRSAYAEFRSFVETLDPSKNISINHVHEEMMYGFKTLRHLSSPETVRVLGDMLSETWQAPFPQGADYFPPALAHEAVSALEDLPIRNQPPGSEIRNTEMIEGALPVWQDWYAKVASGEQTFSFKGTDVEYRFKPDGAWETIPISNPPDDGYGGREAGEPVRQAKRRVRETTADDFGNEARGTKGWLLVTVSLIVVLCGIWFWSSGGRRPAT